MNISNNLSRKNINIIIFFLSLSITNVVYAETLSLQEAIKTGLENNINIINARNASKKSRNKYTLKIFIPNMKLGFKDHFTYDTKTDQFQSSKDLVLSLPINLVDKLYSYKKVGIEQNLDDSKFQDLVLKHIYDIAQAYYTVIFEQQKLSVLKINIEVSRQHKEDMKRSCDLGRESKLHYTSAVINHNNELSALALQEESFVNAKANLCLLIGRKNDIDFTVESSIVINDISTTILSQMNVATSSELKTKQYAIDLANLQTKIIWTKIIPTFATSIHYKLDKTNGDTWKDRVSFGISASINLYDLANLSNDLQSAYIDNDNALSDMSIKKTHLHNQLKTAIMKYETKKANYLLEKENVELSRENFLAVKQQYAIGQLSNLEYNDAKKNAETAELNLFRKIYEIKLAELNIYFLIGDKDMLIR